MANPVTFASAQQFTGIAKEAQQGTPIPMTATLPTDKFDNDDKYTLLEDNASRGSFVEAYDQIQGPGHSECTIAGPVYSDTVGWLAAGILGDYAVSGAGPYIHTMSLLNGGASNGQPTSYTLTDYTGIGTHGGRAWPGQVFESLMLKWTADGLFMYEAKSKGWLSTPLAATPAAAPSVIEAGPGWKIAPTLAAAPVVDMPNAEITITRKIQVIDTSDGTQNPYFIRAGKVGVAFKFSRVAADESALTKYLTNVIEAFVATLNKGTTDIVSFQITKAAYKVAKRNLSKEAVEFDVEGISLGSTADAGASGGYSPIKVTITNSVATAVYA